MCIIESRIDDKSHDRIVYEMIFEFLSLKDETSCSFLTYV